MSIFGRNNAMKVANKGYRFHVDGNKLLEAGKPEEAKAKHVEAMKCYEEAYNDGLDRVGLLTSYAILLMRQGVYEKAKEVFLRIHYKPGLSPDDRFELRINYSVCLWRLGNLDDAIVTIKRAAEELKTTSIFTTLGLYLIQKADETGDFAEAIAFNEEAYAYDEEDAAILDNIGSLHMIMCEHLRRNDEKEQAMSERKLAYDYLTRAHKLRPRQATTLYYLSKMLHEDGQNERADQFITAALSGNFSGICPVSREMVETLHAEIKQAM